MPWSLLWTSFSITITLYRSIVNHFKNYTPFVAVVQSLRCVQLFASPWTAAQQAPLSSSVSQSLIKFVSIEPVMLPNLSSSVTPFSSCLQFFPASGSFPMSRLFASGGQSIGASAEATSPSNEYSGLISFRIDWVDLLAVWGALESLLQHHSLKASILRHSAFFMFQLSHPYIITGKMIALTI